MYLAEVTVLEITKTNITRIEQINMKALGLPLRANEAIHILKNMYLIDQS